MVIVIVVVVVVAAAICVALARALTRAQATAREAQGQVESARAEAARATGDLDAAKGELADAKSEAQAASEEADRAKADAQTQRVQAAGARAEAEAARVKMAELTKLADRSGGDEGTPPGGFDSIRSGSGGAGRGGVEADEGALVAAAGAGVGTGASTATRPGAAGALGSDTSGAASSVSRQAGPSASTLGALWSLARIRQEWLSRQVAGMTLEDAPSEGTWSQVTLEEVLDEEVSRIREDTGTPGALRTSLHDEPPAGEALLLLAGVQALLEALTRHCQAYDLYVHHWEQRLTAIVVCEGFDGPDRVASDTEAVLSAIAPAGGELALDRDQQGRLRARLSLPFRQPAEI